MRSRSWLRWELVLITSALLSLSYVALDASFWSPWWWTRALCRVLGSVLVILTFANMVRIAKNVWVNTGGWR